MKILFLAALLIAQVPPSTSEQPRMSIEGVVVDMEGRPLSGAEVRALWAPAPASYQSNAVPIAITDATGRFQIQELHPGGYTIGVTIPGYVYQEYGVAPGKGRSGNVVTLAPGQPTNVITIRLTRDAIISGRVTSTNGAPLLGIDIWAMRRLFDASGWPFLQAEARTQTNDRGEYRLSDLAADAYYVRVAPVHTAQIERDRRAALIFGRPLPPAPTPGVFAAVFYPAAQDLAGATLIVATPGEETRNIDVVLPTQQTFTIRGRISGLLDDELPKEPRGQELATHISISTMPLREHFVAGSGGSWNAYRQDGTFELDGVAPGSYRVIVTPPLPRMSAELLQLRSTPGIDPALLPGPPPQGVAYVRVGNADVDNVELTMVRNLTITGTVSVDDKSVAPTGVKMALHFINSNGRTGSAVGRMINDTGQFAYTNLTPGQYRPSLSGLPSNLYIKEARLGDIDVLTQGLTLTRPLSDALNIVLAKGSVIEGTLRTELGQAVPLQQIVLVPDRVPQRPDLYKTTITDANGRFLVEGVAPGNYKAFAWQSIEPFRYFDTEFVRRFEDKGTIVPATTDTTADVILIP